MRKPHFVSFDNGTTYHSDHPDDRNISILDGIVSSVGAARFYSLIEKSVPSDIRIKVMETVNTPWWSADSFNPSDLLTEYMETATAPIVIDLTGLLFPDTVCGPYTGRFAYDASTGGLDAHYVAGIEDGYGNMPFFVEKPAHWTAGEYAEYRNGLAVGLGLRERHTLER